ncbi:hypothetical protein AG1IA_06839 [Rhizoctonia solani AG-1 IA]|uniref:Uncharacterized protein n=1 Tax=Thanatephorus cucumeris (strain AG1-IA) TaxID=983506 RepID=L8WME0_THACA|nr:hypothetical protein AG1IA_06839 [Rhizoctonia solani AG-1 IA]
MNKIETRPTNGAYLRIRERAPKTETCTWSSLVGYQHEQGAGAKKCVVGWIRLEIGSGARNHEEMTLVVSRFQTNDILKESGI